jgi:hypothetical protein
MKVQIKNTVKRFGYNGVKYLPGDIVEIEDNYFRSDFMTKVEDPPVAVEASTLTEAPIKKRKPKPLLAEADAPTTEATN